MTETKLRSGLIMLIGALGVLQPFSLDTYLPSLGQMAKDMSVSEGVIQQNLTFLTLGVSIGTVLTGPITDAIGRRKPALFALVGYIFAALLTANAVNVEMLFAGRVLQGLTAACLVIVANAMLRDLHEGIQLIKAFALSMVVASSSWFIGPAFGSFLQTFTNWRGLSYILAALAAALFALIAWKLPDTMHVDDRTKSTAKQVAVRFRHLARDRVFLGLLTVQSTISISLFSYLSVSPFVYDNAYQVEPIQVGYFLAINSFLAYIGGQVGAKLSEKLTPPKALTIGLIIGAVAGAGLIATTTMSLGFIAFTSLLALFTLGFGITITPLVGMAMTKHPDEAGTAAAMVAVSGTLATTISGGLYAVLDHTSSIGIGATMLGFMSLGIFLLYAVVKPNKMEAMK
jgi:DHA1 family bicyclomycin/chloramphenicol resistance-like MFS transporter